MRKINPLSLGFTFAGCFLGAGYVSGQELWQFFGSFGIKGISGLFCALLAQFVFGIIIIRLACITKIEAMDKIIMPFDCKLIENILGFLQAFFMLGIFVIMTAGAGALINRLFDVNSSVGAIIFCVIVTFTSQKGYEGIINVFSFFVPVMTVFTVILSIFAVCMNGFSLNDVATNENPMLFNWFISSMVYVSYNIFASIGIITPLASFVKKKSTVYIGVGMGSLVLFGIAFGILSSISSSETFVSAELPMLELVASINMPLCFLYALMLIGGMFGTSLSSLVAVVNYCGIKSESFKKRKNLYTLLLSAISAGLSLWGFADIISIVYPLCGYLGLISMILIIINFIKTKRKI